MIKMTKEELAAKLDGNQIGEETTSDIEREAKDNHLLIVFGASDDLCEFRGAVDDEFDCYEGGEIECPEIKDKITAIWCEEGKGIPCAWSYSTQAPHAEFNIYEDGEVYCVGIVVDLSQQEPGCEYCRNLQDISVNFDYVDGKNIHISNEAVIYCPHCGRKRED